jgi:sugar transferase (PEP-CTERM/EpsH1 system associated)
VNVLFLTHRLPFAPNRGDRIRAFHMIRALRECADVSILSLVHDSEEERRIVDVQPLVESVHTARVPRWRNLAKAAVRLPTRRPLTLELLSAPSVRRSLRQIIRERPPDVVLAYCSSMARYAMEPPLDGIPWILDMVDLDSQKWQALGARGDWLHRFVYRREAFCLQRFERSAVRSARVTLAVNEKESDAIRELIPEADVRVLGVGVDVAGFAPRGGPSAKPQVIFCGVLDYRPNEAAVERLALDIWPQVRSVRPDAQLLIVGANPTAGIRQLPRRDPSISVTGAVPDVRPFLWASAFAVIPLRTARGVQNKVLEALAAGLPAVVSGTVADGLPPSVRAGCAIAESDADFVRTIGEWLALSPARRREIARRADLESVTWARQLEPLCAIVREVASSAAPSGESYNRVDVTAGSRSRK